MTSIQDAALLEELGLSRNLAGDSRTTELGQEDFLKLMTMQLKNQDPFEPMENGDSIARSAAVIEGDSAATMLFEHFFEIVVY